MLVACGKRLRLIPKIQSTCERCVAQVIGLRSLVRSKVFFKLLLAFFVVIATATLILDFSIRHAWENSLRAEVTQSLTEKARMFAFRVNSDKNAAISQIVSEEAQASGAR